MLAVAEQVFATRGIQATTMDEVAELVGVTKPLIYDYFGSKEGLLAATIERARGQLLTALIDSWVANPTAPARDRVGGVVLAFFSFIDEHEQAFSLLRTEGALIGEASASVERIRQQTAKAFAEGLRTLPAFEALEPHRVTVMAEILIGGLRAAGRLAQHPPRHERRRGDRPRRDDDLGRARVRRRGLMAKHRPADGPSTPATVALDRAGVTYTRHPYEHDPSAAELRARGSRGPRRRARAGPQDPPRRHRQGPRRRRRPGRRTARPQGRRAGAGVKSVTMADPAAAERSTGYVVGGISPVGQKRALPTVLDDTAYALEIVYVSGGRRGFDIGLSPADLATVTRARPGPHRPPGQLTSRVAAEALRPSHGVDSTIVVRVETFAAARIRASRSSRSPGVATRTLRM